MLGRIMINPEELAEKLYEEIVDDIINELEKIPRLQYANAFIEAGYLVSVFGSTSNRGGVNDLEKKAASYISHLPMCIIKILSCKEDKEMELIDEYSLVIDIIKEIVRRIELSAQYAYEMFEYNHNGLMECSCGEGGLPSLQQFEVYDSTYYGDDTDEDNEHYLKRENNEENFMGTHYRYKCIMCEKSTPLYNDDDKAKQAWNRMNIEADE